jgi:hypothetical protein
MPPLEDVDDVCLEYLVEGEALVVRRAINMHISRWMTWKVRGRTYSTRDTMFIIRYVA